MATKLLKKIQDQLLKEELSDWETKDIMKKMIYESKSISQLVFKLSPYYCGEKNMYKIIINIIDKF